MRVGMPLRWVAAGTFCGSVIRLMCAMAKITALKPMPIEKISVILQQTKRFLPCCNAVGKARLKSNVAVGQALGCRAPGKGNKGKKWKEN